MALKVLFGHDYGSEVRFSTEKVVSNAFSVNQPFKLT